GGPRRIADGAADPPAQHGRPGTDTCRHRSESDGGARRSLEYERRAVAAGDPGDRPVGAAARLRRGYLRAAVDQGAVGRPAGSGITTARPDLVGRVALLGLGELL